MPHLCILYRDACLFLCNTTTGLARAHWEGADVNLWTDYVATRWYRAPELILTHFTPYSTAIDIWSVGCIFAEMLGKGTPLFPGKDGYHQLTLMIGLLGSPTPEALNTVQSDAARHHFASLQYRPYIDRLLPVFDKLTRSYYHTIHELHEHRIRQHPHPYPFHTR